MIGSSQAITICGFYGNHNLGDEAMLSGLLTLLPDSGPVTVFSDDPADTAQRYGVSAIARQGRRAALGRWRQMLGSRAFVLGGGDLLRDSQQSSIAQRWLQPLQRAIALGRPTLALGLSVGEIFRPESEALIPAVLNRVNLVAVRDRASQAKLQALGVRQPVQVMSDLALAALSGQRAPLPPDGRSPHLGISVRHLARRGPSVDPHLGPTLLKELAAVTDALVERYDAVVHFLPLRTHPQHYHPWDDDYVATLQLLQYSRHSARCVVHRSFPRLEDLTRLLSSLDGVIGMRLHSLILAAGLGVPVVGLAYDPKVTGFMAEIDQSHRTLPLEAVEQAAVLAQVDDFLGDRAAAREAVWQGVQRYCQPMASVEGAIAQVLGGAQ